MHFRIHSRVRVTHVPPLNCLKPQKRKNPKMGVFRDRVLGFLEFLDFGVFWGVGFLGFFGVFWGFWGLGGLGSTLWGHTWVMSITTRGWARDKMGALSKPGLMRLHMYSSALGWALLFRYAAYALGPGLVRHSRAGICRIWSL